MMDDFRFTNINPPAPLRKGGNAKAPLCKGGNAKAPLCKGGRGVKRVRGWLS